MPRATGRSVTIGGLLLAGLAAGVATAWGQFMVAPLTLDRLVRMSPPELEALYARSGPGAVPAGPVRGRALVAPGSPLGPALSGAARLLWQGKVFHSAEGWAINRFFGLKVIRGSLSVGPSWRDGAPALILDYRATSHLYRHYRDEIRQVAPGLYLGLMYDDRTCPPALKMYFALETCP